VLEKTSRRKGEQSQIYQGGSTMKHRKYLSTSAWVAMVAAALVATPAANAAETKGPVSDDIGVLVIQTPRSASTRNAASKSPLRIKAERSSATQSS
jgi:hypothetical protein